MYRQLSRWGVYCMTAVLGVATSFGQIGPDVIVNDLFNTQHYGPVGNIHGYAVGTESCNIGDQDLLWDGSTSAHPVIAQNMYRLKDGRIEQIGVSWVKHGFITIDSGNCGVCPPDGTGDHLSPGCSDPYSAGLNGDRNRLGPRYEVNATKGVFPYPYDDSAPVVDELSRRVQVPDDDVNPALNAGALYFVEGQYVTRDDAGWGNSANNNSYRRVSVSDSANRTLTLEESVYQQVPAIHAWRDHGNGVGIPDTNVAMVAVDVPLDGRFWVGAKCTDNGDGTWHYEYAVQNLTSDRSGGSFSVPVPVGATVSNVGFKDIDYHSGEPWDPTDWNWSITGDTVTWSSPETYAQNPDTNALRWGTLYNFWFDVDAPAVAGDATLGLFKSGTPAAVAAMVVIPDPAAAACPSPGAGGFYCTADIFGDDCIVDLQDLGQMLSNYGVTNGATHDDGDIYPPGGDGAVSLEDLGTLLAQYDDDCN
jgi:hypothetical protein